MIDKHRRPQDRHGWDQRYVDGDLPWDSGKPDAHLCRVVDDYGIRRAKGLEIGCGTGTNTIWLAQNGFEMTGVDVAPTAIAEAEAKLADAGVDCRFLVADFLADDILGVPFDFVYDRGCFHVFDHAADRSRFAACVANSLASEGVWHSLIGSTDGPPRDSGPPRRRAGEIAAAVEPHFEILELRSTVFDKERHDDKRAWVLVARRRSTVVRDFELRQLQDESIARIRARDAGLRASDNLTRDELHER